MLIMANRRFVISPVKKLLFERNISQSQFSRDIGVSYVYLNRIINGWIPASPDLKQRISKYFELSESEIFNEPVE